MVETWADKEGESLHGLLLEHITVGSISHDEPLMFGLNISCSEEKDWVTLPSPEGIDVMFMWEQRVEWKG